LHLGERLLHLGEEPLSISEHVAVPFTLKLRDQLAVARLREECDRVGKSCM